MMTQPSLMSNTGESQRWKFENSSFARDNSSNFLYFCVAKSYHISNSICCLFIAFHVCLKDWSRIDIIVCCLLLKSYHVAQITCPVHFNL